MGAAPALGDASVLARHKDFYCGSYAADPIYTPDRASGLVGTLRSYQDENQMPQLALDRGWKAATPAHCGIAVNGGETTEAGQAAAVQRQFKSVEDALGRFDGNELAATTPSARWCSRPTSCSTPRVRAGARAVA